jgi:hypothetical protein
MQPLLAQVQLMDLAVTRLKEQIFDIIVELSPRQFDQLCSEVIGLYRFQKKYRDVLITDSPHLIQPFAGLLPRVEFLFVLNEQSYDRSRFYRWLEEVPEHHLQQIVMEIDALYDEAIENVDCYVVSEPLCEKAPKEHCWRMQLETSGNLSSLFNNVSSWKK